MTDTVALQEFATVATEAAHAAGDVLQRWRGKFTAKEKSPANLVTEADLASEKEIHRLIVERYPDHGFLGEEGLSQPSPDSPYRWIIDPLDGTSNYVHGFPYYAVSIGLECDNELIVGVILDPNNGELFCAVRGQGATLNGEPISTSTANQLSEAMAVASLPIRPEPNDPAIARFLNVLGHAQTVQRTGSAALNLAYVAAGRMEIYWSSSLKPWDMAAGALIVEEAGGRVTRLGGEKFQVEEREVLATNGTAIHEQIIAAF